MMEFGEAVLFAKFLREHGTAEQRYRRAVLKKRNVAEEIQKDDPGLWFKWLAWKAARKHARKDTQTY